MIHVPRLKDEYAAELFLGATLLFFQYRVRAVSGP
jgi:hypothetical protein